jgi:hypothetical protein
MGSTVEGGCPDATSSEGVVMQPRHRTLGLAWLAGTAMVMTAPGSWALAQDPSVVATAGPPLAEFHATLMATQTEHLGELLKVVIDPPNTNPACRDGLESNSTDQVLTLTSDPVDVDLVQFAGPQEGWGDQTSFLVAHGGTVDDISIFGPPAEMNPTLLFSLPTTVGVKQTHSRPAIGDLPPTPYVFKDPCGSSGSGDGPAPSPVDCSNRQFHADTWVTIPTLGTLSIIGGGIPDDAQTSFDDCSGSMAMETGAFTNGDYGDTFTVTGGDLPTEQLLDATAGQVAVSGNADGRFVQPGTLTPYHLTWTLTLCRVVSGAPAC